MQVINEHLGLKDELFDKMVQACVACLLSELLKLSKSIAGAIFSSASDFTEYEREVSFHMLETCKTSETPWDKWAEISCTIIAHKTA